ncbi:MAG: ISNCY family transposase, partial [Lachnospiraceae bacterium]
TAALKIACTKRHINRLIAGYKASGKAFFVHGNHAHKPVTTISEDTKNLVYSLYQTKYFESNLTHYQELLAEMENIHLSVSSISSILRKNYILSPKAHRSTKKKLKQELNALNSKTKSKKQQAAFQSSILAIDEAHPRHPRSAFFGEMIQMDASEYYWFGDIKTHLHIAVDDASGTLVGAWFDTQETLNGYYNVLHQILTEYGIPYQFFTDNRTVFEYKKKDNQDVEKDTFTQFGYACKQLGIDIRTSSIPQSKGRVERMNATLQSRLAVELRLNNVASIDEANKFLNSYIKKFNKRFALPIDSIKSVFETQPDSNKINLTLAILSSRKIDNGSCLKYHKDYYLPVDANGHAVHHRKGTSVMVIKAFDGELYSCIGEQIYGLEKLLEHHLVSKAFDLAELSQEPKKKYIPPMSHPWKKTSFDKYMNKQSHRKDIA